MELRNPRYPLGNMTQPFSPDVERLVACWTRLDEWWDCDEIQDTDEVYDLRFADGFIQALLFVSEHGPVPDEAIEEIEWFVDDLTSVLEAIKEN